MPMPVEQQVVVLFAASRGFLDAVKVKDIAAFNDQMLAQIDPALLASVKKNKDLRKDDLDNKLTEFVGKFSKSFVATIGA